MPRAQAADAPAPADAAPAPAVVRLTRPYGFIDAFGRHRVWKAGDVIGNPEEIALLESRGAPIAAA